MTNISILVNFPKHFSIFKSSLWGLPGCHDWKLKHTWVIFVPLYDTSNQENMPQARQALVMKNKKCQLKSWSLLKGSAMNNDWSHCLPTLESPQKGASGWVDSWVPLLLDEAIGGLISSMIFDHIFSGCTRFPLLLILTKTWDLYGI